jgi:glycosyltransferase involved in cell wall biosynthesis
MVITLITLVAPASENFLTGGYIYNKEMTERLSADGTLRYYTIDAQSDLSFLHQARLVVLDSLFIQHPELLFPVINKTSGVRFLGLIHYLPSLDPFLTAGVKKSMQYRELRFLAGMDAYITTSNSMKQVLSGLGIPEVKINVCPPGVAPRFTELRKKRYAKPDHSRILLTVSSVTRSKNLLWLLRILESLSDTPAGGPSVSGAPWEWRIAGGCREDSRYASQFLQAVRTSPVRDRISLLDLVDRSMILEQLAEADLFLFPSAAESYGMAPLEAAAAGVPVVANTVGAIEEFIRDGENGHLFSPFDRQGWRQTVAKLLRGDIHTEGAAKAAVSESKFPTWDEAAARLKKYLVG